MGKHPTSNIQHPTPRQETREIWVFNDGESANRKFNLENRLLEFASAVIDLTEKLPSSRAGDHVAGQILRSGTSPYPNHGESEELVRIFFSSIQTAQKNNLKQKHPSADAARYPAGKAG